ncbi:MAG: hypothetical protein R2704_02170 [Microthrixaceae bacterium]
MGFMSRCAPQRARTLTSAGLLLAVAFAAAALVACGDLQAVDDTSEPWPTGGRRTTAAAFSPNLIDGEFIGVVNTPGEAPALARWLEGDQFEVIAELPRLVAGGTAVPLDTGILILGSGPPTPTIRTRAR